MSKVTVNIEWLSDCSGCHVAIVDLHEKILNVLEAVEIQRCPVLTDVKDYPPATVGLVSGAVRNEHDRHAAIAMRESCDVIVAWGACAVFGGPAGAGTSISGAPGGRATTTALCTRSLSSVTRPRPAGGEVTTSFARPPAATASLAPRTRSRSGRAAASPSPRGPSG